jgi:septum site-determining protein MinC
MTGEAITIKGTNEGLVINLGDGPFEETVANMEAQLSSKASFFVGGRVALDVGDRALSREQLTEIGGVLERIGVTLWAVDGTHPTTCLSARELGLEAPQAPASATVPVEISHEDVAGYVVRRTLRSGQALRHAGHLALIGDVNPGAEVVAGGDIIVWGKLRGTVHAGAMGDENAIICALQLAPSQIRIGTRIARSPERGRPPSIPELARVYDGVIVVERWGSEGKQKLGLGSWSSKLKTLFGQE